jgi:hypothetical protein
VNNSPLSANKTKTEWVVVSKAGKKKTWRGERRKKERKEKKGGTGGRGEAHQ